MTFLTTLGLSVALLVVVPYLAHRLRRRRAEEQPFPPARLVGAAPPKARRRSRLEHRALLATRAAAIAALAILGATPFVRCSRLSLTRVAGASIGIALVIDDSMSMRADAGGKSRFERARDGARDILSTAREGDAFTVVLAGAPSRVALAATTDLSTARRVIDSLAVSDRATDLDGALVLASGLIASLPQVDRRIAVLSDLADGRPDAAALGESVGFPLWIPLPELRGSRADCAVLKADERGRKVRVSIACGPEQSAIGREVLLESAEGKVLGRAPVTSAPDAEITFALSDQDPRPDRAMLSGSDAIAADDFAPVATNEARGTIAIAADPSDEQVATGGAPIVEQALEALKLDVQLSPIPSVPDRVEDFAADLGIVIDDPPGLTPEQRRALAAFVESGAVALVALGPHAAAAPLGATLEPLLTRAVTWDDTSALGADVQKASGLLAATARSLSPLGAQRRATLAAEDIAATEPLLRWDDGAPLVMRRAVGRGEAWLVTLPFSVDASDLTLRPGFLGILDAWTRLARDRVGPQRSEVGSVWSFPGAEKVKVRGPDGPLAVEHAEGAPRVVPPVVGAYRFAIDGKAETRIAAPVARELDLRPRSVAPSVARAGAAAQPGSADVSGQVAIGLLGLVALELALRLHARHRAAARGDNPVATPFSSEAKACDPAS